MIVVRNSDNLAIFSGENFVLTEEYLTDGKMKCFDVNKNTAKIYDIEKPINYIDGCFTYNDGLFYITSNGQEILDRLEAKKAQRIIAEKQSKTRQDIISLESQITNRRMREAMVTGDYKFINDIEKQITELRNELKGL